MNIETEPTSSSPRSVVKHLDDCVTRIQVNKIGTGPLNVNLYNFSNTRFASDELSHPELQTLIESYAHQLLLPLFQESPLYQRVNTRRDYKPRYDESAAQREVSKYLGMTDELTDRVYIFAASPNGERRFSELIGYGECYGIEQGGLKSLFDHKFKPGSVGANEGDTFDGPETLADFDVLEGQDNKFVYFDGIGVNKDFQGQGMGLELLSMRLDECVAKGYTHLITRVIRGASNWNLYNGINDDHSTAIPTTKIVAKYFNDQVNPDTYYRAIFTTEIEAARQYIHHVLEEKGISIEPRTTDTYTITDPNYGTYVQTVYDNIDEAGHKQLASEGKYGWGMPTDSPTEEFVVSAAGKVILEIGTGLGDNLVLPALINDSTVYATDVSPEHFSEEYPMRQNAKTLGREEALHTYTLNENWWYLPLSPQPGIKEIFGADALADLPQNGTVDAIMARHSLQFGDPDTFLRFLDLASAALKSGGTATAINFTPYTEYMYQYDDGLTMKRIAELNYRFANGEINLPGSYIHSQKGPIKTSLSRLMSRSELDRGEENTFLYFDEPTLIGLLNLWKQSRIERGLPVDLEVADSAYFTPPSIARVNKLVSEPELRDRENFVFTIRKV